MNTIISPIIEVDELLKIHKLEDVIIIDACNGDETNYIKKHLKGALVVNLNTQLSSIKEDVSIGGRHPLPTINQFSETLNKLGIFKESHVIIYDDKNGSNSAARFWWMLKAVGHNKVQVVNGGFQEAERKGFPVNSDVVISKKTTEYKITSWIFPQADIQEVEKYSLNKNYKVIDVREKDRYNGVEELIDLIAGHIPGAINIPFSTNLNNNGLFKNPKELKEQYQAIFKNTKSENSIVHCGSGVTACHTLLALTYAGFNIPKLYVGSWSEWSRNKKSIKTNKTNS
ncbi:MAG: sulfurtransferase [Lutibacter sp.]|uniref:sulfurtransferase n=1 Tax=Lutibacter sp. TaxID=1925666 RepID=UPI0019E0E8E2|nr:sulfurtransferase [Lutibacter sp.]NOR28035.1 sulfurtransferase [Lutibacter sp.]